MAEETLDAAVKAHNLSAGPSRTVGLMLEGGKDWTPTLYIRLVQDYGLENEVGCIANRSTPICALWSGFNHFVMPRSLMILWERESLATPC